MSDLLYTDGFYAYHEEGARRSAREMIPLVFRFVRPKSVIDVGCGNGTWLAEFQAAGVADCVGVDGDYVSREKLLIPASQFSARDLTQPLKLDRRFDMAMSLEVAEHLPAHCATGFVESLVRLSPVVLFSAAIPHQGGVDHVNEQWPEYWQEQFQKFDYVVVDCLRRLAWKNKEILPWYRQNMLFFVERKRLNDYPALAEALSSAPKDTPLSYVLPDFYVFRQEYSLKKMRDAMRTAMRYAVGLRELNFAVFPDWSQSQEQVVGQIRALVNAIMSRQDRARIAVVFSAGSHKSELINGILDQAFAHIRPGGVPMPGSPALVAVGDVLGPKQWEVLVDCLRGRICLPRDDAAEMARTGAFNLAPTTLADLRSQSFPVR